jgi:hypothetical protein
MASEITELESKLESAQSERDTLARSLDDDRQKLEKVQEELGQALTISPATTQCQYRVFYPYACGIITLRTCSAQLTDMWPELRSRPATAIQQGHVGHLLLVNLATDLVLLER